LQSSSLGRFGSGLLFGSANARDDADVGITIMKSLVKKKGDYAAKKALSIADNLTYTSQTQGTCFARTKEIILEFAWCCKTSISSIFLSRELQRKPYLGQFLSI